MQSSVESFNPLCLTTVQRSCDHDHVDDSNYNSDDVCRDALQYDSQPLAQLLLLLLPPLLSLLLLLLLVLFLALRLRTRRLCRQRCNGSGACAQTTDTNCLVRPKATANG